MSAGELVARCFHARTAAHIFHLKTRSYAVHMALHGFYDEIVDLADAFAETYQGCIGLIEDYPTRYTMPATAEAMLSELYNWIEDNRESIAEEPHLQALIDDIQSLIDSTQYKLKFLK